jgi:hypothetical protein
MLPRFSMASSRRTMSPRLLIARAPAESVTLMIAGNSCGDSPTARAIAARARALVLAKLEKMRSAGHDIAAVLDQSVLSGWTDVCPPKQPNGRASPASVSEIRLAQAQASLEDARRRQDYWSQSREVLGTCARCTYESVQRNSSRIAIKMAEYQIQEVEREIAAGSSGEPAGSFASVL